MVIDYREGVYRMGKSWARHPAFTLSRQGNTFHRSPFKRLEPLFGSIYDFWFPLSDFFVSLNVTIKLLHVQ